VKFDLDLHIEKPASHAFLKITLDNPAAFPDIPMQTGQKGRQFFTLEAEQSWILWLTC